MFATISCSLTFILTLTMTAIITFGVTYMCIRQKPDASNDQPQPTQKAFYEEISPSVKNTRNPAGDASHKQATQDLKNSSGENGYELIASVRVQRDLDRDAPLKCGRTHEPSNKSDRYIQTMKHPALYHSMFL